MTNVDDLLQEILDGLDQLELDANSRAAIQDYRACQLDLVGDIQDVEAWKKKKQSKREKLLQCVGAVLGLGGYKWKVGVEANFGVKASFGTKDADENQSDDSAESRRLPNNVTQQKLAAKLQEVYKLLQTRNEELSEAAGQSPGARSYKDKPKECSLTSSQEKLMLELTRLDEQHHSEKRRLFEELKLSFEKAEKEKRRLAFEHRDAISALKEEHRSEVSRLSAELKKAVHELEQCKKKMEKRAGKSPKTAQGVEEHANITEMEYAWMKQQMTELVNERDALRILYNNTLYGSY